MAGKGKRFIDAGYKIPKPLIKVDGKPMIEFVVGMFPGESDIIFVCDKEHLASTELEVVLRRIASDSKILPIDGHNEGSAYTTLRAAEEVEDDEDVMVCYCDFNVGWDYNEFKKRLAETECEGAVPSYTGFHPHLRHKKLYASILADEDGFMTDMREKHCFTDDPMECFQSCGMYYFKRGGDMKRYLRELINGGERTNGEYYVSMAYPFYKRDGKKVYVHRLSHFLQWGTPEDLEEYEAWSRFFAEAAGKEKAETEIPEARANLVKINLDPASEIYKKTYDYWSNYFSLCDHHPYTREG